MNLRAHLWLAFVLLWCAWLLLALYRATTGDNDLDELRTTALLMVLIIFGYLAVTRDPGRS